MRAMSALPLYLALALVAQDGEGSDDKGDTKSFDVGFGFDDEEETEPAPERKPDPEPEVEPVPPPKPPPVLPPPSAPPAPPVATSGPTVLVVLIPNEPAKIEAGRRIGASATRMLAEQTQRRPASLAARLDPGAALGRRAGITRSKQLIEEGVQAFEELDLETAGTKLDIGVNQLLAYERFLSDRDREVLSLAIFAYGATVLFEGQTELADSIFVALAVTDPEFTPSSDRYPSNVVDRFTALAGSVASRPSGTLTVETVPPGATVYVDGTFRGFAPLDVGGLPDGWHVVTTERLGYRPFGTLAPVPADRTSTLELELEPSDVVDRVAELDPRASDDEAAVRAMRKAFGVDAIAVLRYMTPLSGDRVEGMLIDGDEPPLKLPSTAIQSSDPEVAAKAILLGFDAARQAKVVTATAPVAEAGAPVTGEWWFWAAVTGAVVVAAAGTVAVVASRGDSGPPSNSPVVLGF